MKLSTSKIDISGLNLERKLNMLNKQGIEIFEIRRISKRKCTILVSSANTRQIIDLLSEKCYNNDGTVSTIPPSVKPQGVAMLKAFAIKHIAFFVAIALIFPLLWLSSTICFKIDINSSLPTSQVEESLAQFGITVGKSLKNLDIGKLQNHLCTTLHVSYAQIQVRGSVLYINLIDRVDFDNYIDLNSPLDVVALFDGTITKLTVIQGNPLVTVGDNVKKGQTLIEGKRLFNDGTSVDVRAIGEVFASVSVSQKVDFSPVKTVFVQTGNTQTRTVINIGKISTCTKEIAFLHYELVEKMSILYPLNIVVAHQTLWELKQVSVEVSFSDELENLKTQALHLAMQKAYFVPTFTEYDIVSNKSVTVTLHGEIKITSLLTASNL